MKTSFSRLLIFVVVLGLGMGIAFGAGIAVNQASAPKALAAAQARSTGSQQGNGFSGQGGTGAGGSGFGANGRPAVAGTVGSVDNGTITVTSSQGTSTKVSVGDKTTIQKNVSGTIDDVKPGDRIVVTGDRGADGAVSATTIQVMPAPQQAQQ